MNMGQSTVFACRMILQYKAQYVAYKLNHILKRVNSTYALPLEVPTGTVPDLRDIVVLKSCTLNFYKSAHIDLIFRISDELRSYKNCRRKIKDARATVRQKHVHASRRPKLAYKPS